MRVIKAMVYVILLFTACGIILVFYGINHSDTPVRKHTLIWKNKIRPQRWTDKDRDAFIDEVDRLNNNQ